MKPENKAARQEMNKARNRAKPQKVRQPKPTRKYEVFDGDGMTIGFLTVHGKVR